MFAALSVFFICTASEDLLRMALEGLLCIVSEYLLRMGC